MQCHEKEKAPRAMTRGSATTHCQFAYFAPEYLTSVYRYDWTTDKWDQLASCPYSYSALVIIDGELTAVGGHDGSYTNKLFTLQQGQWVEKSPAMNTARSRTAVVRTSDGDIIVIGGYCSGYSWTTTVELLERRIRRWYKLTNLPHVQPLSYPSATICGNQLHVIGDDGDGPLGLGYSCSLQGLPSSDQPITSQSILTWTSLPHLPVTGSTAATLCGQLVIIGGKQGLSPVNSIHQLVDGQWVQIGSMSRARVFPIVVSPSPNKIMIVGGEEGNERQGVYYPVEMCTVV